MVREDGKGDRVNRAQMCRVAFVDWINVLRWRNDHTSDRIDPLTTVVDGRGAIDFVAHMAIAITEEPRISFSEYIVQRAGERRRGSGALPDALSL